MRILFMGTPDFALFSLSALLEMGEEVIAVVTQPDKPKGRGYELLPPPVKTYAEAHGIPVCQPNTLKGEEFASLLERLCPELIVVTAYGKILPENVLKFPKYGCINVHGSLLPAYRGAAPMQRAILDGNAETGITTMLMDAGMDTGDMLLSARIKILPDDNFESIHDKLGECSKDLLKRTVREWIAGRLIPKKQDGAKATYAAKIEKEDCRIDFSETATAVHNRIRALSPIPLAFTTLPNGKLLKVTKAELSEGEGEGEGGEVLSLKDGKITVACKEGAISLLSVIPEGKKKMTAQDFINGRQIAVGDRLGNGN